MSDQTQDKSSQTEEPTEKKQSDAKQKGNTPNSREVGTLLTFLAAFTLVAGAGSWAMAELGHAMVPLIDRPDELIAGPTVGDLSQMIGNFIAETALTLLPVFLLFMMAGILAMLVQGNARLAPDRIQPKLERISPKKGAERIFGRAALVEFSFGLIKLTLIGSITTFVLWPAIAQAESFVFKDVPSLPSMIREFTMRLLVAVASSMTLIAAVDILWRRFDWRRNLRMSHKEIKDEMKQVEGDPMVKRRLREIRQSRARRRMLEAVPNASVVVMNPTHYAVALRYERGIDAVPVCVAKGLDLVALKIRETAEKHGVPVVEEPPLARALHASMEVGHPISSEFYKAVAEIISYVLGQKTPARQKN